MLRIHSKGVILADDPATPFHLATQDCRGTKILGADGAPAAGRGFCDAVDGAGDTWTLWYRAAGNGSTWGIIAGTGKYASMTGGGTTKALVSTADGRSVIRWEGSWERWRQSAGPP